MPCDDASHEVTDRKSPPETPVAEARAARSARVAEHLGSLPAPEHLGEGAWIEVIQRMDEVYSHLLEYQVALEEKNPALEDAEQFLTGVHNATSAG